MTFYEILLFGSGALFFAGAIKGFIGIGLPTIAMALLTLSFDTRTAITLILIPTLYRILEDLKTLFGADEEEFRVSRQVKEELVEDGV